MPSPNGPSSADVVVVGGGPAGSTVSTLLAQHGHRVRLFERERFPRFHIGESLIPETYWVLQQLDMLPKMQASRFVKKYSVHDVLFDGTRAVGVKIKDDEGFHEIRAKVVVDASGQNGLLMNRLGLRIW